jgi:hypothetical protein
MNLTRSALVALTLFALAPAFAASEPEPVAVVDGHPVYGEQMPSGDAIAIGLVLADVDQYAGKPHKFSGRVTKVCQKKGCWMVLADGERSARVMFGEDDFFIPKDTSGNAVVYGTLTARTMSEGMAKHLAKDEGKDPAEVKGEVQEVQITATSVMLLPAS